MTYDNLMKQLFCATLVGALAAGALAQGNQRDIWQPHMHIKDQNIVLVPWGSGNIAETNETAADGAYSLRVSTHNYFQGGFVKFNTPVDLTSNSLDANNMLSFTFRTADSVVIAAQPAAGGAAAGAGGGDGEAGGLRRGGGGKQPVAPGATGGAPGAGQGAPRTGKGRFAGGEDAGAPAAGGGATPTATTPANTLRVVRVII